MADLVLKKNLLELDSKFYKQISGTAFGTKFAPPLCLYLYGPHWNGIFKDVRYKTLVLEDIYRRYFFIWTESEESLEKFLKDLNKFHPNLTFTHEKSKDKINFLDVVIKIKEGRIIIDIYCKPTDGQQALRLTRSDENNSKKVNGVLLVVTYTPAFKNLFQVTRKKLQLLYADEEVKKMFSLAPFVSFRSTRNLKSYLVTSRIYPLEK